MPSADKTRSATPAWRAGRARALALFLVCFLASAQLIRLVLLVRAWGDVGLDASLPAAFAWGTLYDLGAAAWASLPVALLLALLPARFFEGRVGRVSVHLVGVAGLFALLFGGVAEWFFWSEFGARFNFIAVDYLVYTTEVLGNIRESYPLPAILGGLLAVALVLHLALWRGRAHEGWLRGARQPARARFTGLLVWCTGALALGATLSSADLPRFENRYSRELAQNGLWSLFAAFRHNTLDYSEFYLTAPAGENFAELRHELSQDGSILLEPGADDTLRYVQDERSPLRPNIVQITVESLSASHMGIFNPDSELTPNLDALVERSLLFDNFYATGNRTVRGMEALTLSLPPTPGRSVVKRPGNEGLFSLGSVLRSEGYDTAFLYGGYGYFDNMNAFFSGNGYRVVDRASVAGDDVTFSNAWGACDEDLLRWTLREADQAHESGQPFHFFVMTTSNHRPYTYPDGRIDLPSKVSGRAGAVKYTDWAIGDFLRQASERPWFEDTIFVIVADHCAASAGRAEIPLNRYHIPLIVFAPGGQVAPGRVSTLTSQMDYAPTLLGLLHWSYPSRFFGHDVGRIDPSAAHALVGTHELLGHLEQDVLSVLAPREQRFAYDVDRVSLEQSPRPCGPGEVKEAVAFYETASAMLGRGEYRQLTAEETARYAAAGRRAVAARSSGSASSGAGGGQ